MSFATIQNFSVLYISPVHLTIWVCQFCLIVGPGTKINILVLYCIHCFLNVSAIVTAEHVLPVPKP